MLGESLRTFGLLNDRLDRLGPADVEPVLLAMTLMFKDRETSETAYPSWNQRLLFSGHMLQTELAGLDIGRARQTDGYLPAVSSILDRAGGIGALEDRGLAKIICMSVIPFVRSNLSQLFTDYHVGAI